MEEIILSLVKNGKDLELQILLNNISFELLETEQIDILNSIILINNKEYIEAGNILSQIVDNEKYGIIAHEYLSYINYFSPKTISDSLVISNKVVNQNMIVKYLKYNQFDEALALIENLPKNDVNLLLKVIVELKQNHLKTATHIFRNMKSELTFKNYYLSVGEINFYNKKYSKAVINYKKYRELNIADTLYTNHKIAQSFKRIFKYNNSAYYWIKNLSTQKSVYDSLANYELIKLYNFTKKPYSTYNYFQRFYKKYNIEDKLLYQDFVNSLYETRRFEELNKFIEINQENMRSERILGYSLFLGDFFFTNKNYRKAADNFYRVLERTKLDSIEFKYEQSLFLDNQYESFASFADTFKIKYPDNKYKFEICWQYLKSLQDSVETQSIIDYQITFIDSIQSSYQDSIIFLKANTNFETQNYKEAIKLYFMLFNTPQYSEKIYNIIDQIIDNNVEIKIIEQISNLMSDKTKDIYYDKVLLNIAQALEKLQQPKEANFIYAQILSDSTFVDTLQLKYAIVKNMFKLEQFDEIIPFISISDSTADSTFIMNSLYYKFKASQNIDSLTSIEYLLDLHLYFPEFHKKEILFNLYKYFLDEDVKYSYYFLGLLLDDRIKFVDGVNIKKEFDSLARILGKNKAKIDINEIYKSKGYKFE